MITRLEHTMPGCRRSVVAILPRDFRMSFGACYAYSPKGHTELSARSRLLCARLKTINTRWLQCYAAQVRQQVTECHFNGFFGPDTVLVPVPGSDPSRQSACWTAWHLALALEATGLAGRVWVGLSRTTAVKRSATAWLWQRPTVPEHYQSLAVHDCDGAHARIVLIDDVVTKGRTLVAAALRLHASFPQCQIKAFALVRTMGRVPHIQRLIDPCEGVIRWNGRDASRDP